MASINKVILVGNLGADPEARELGENSILTNMSLATTRRYKNRDGEYVDETEWHRVVFFGRTAEVARDYLKKGSQAYVEGRFRTRRYTDKEGVERFTTEIVGETLQLLDRREQGNGEGFQQAQARAQRQPAQSSQRQPQSQPQQAQQRQSYRGGNVYDLEEDAPF